MKWITAYLQVLVFQLRTAVLPVFANSSFQWAKASYKPHVTFSLTVNKCEAGLCQTCFYNSLTTWCGGHRPWPPHLYFMPDLGHKLSCKRHSSWRVQQSNAILCLSIVDPLIKAWKLSKQSKTRSQFSFSKLLGSILLLLIIMIILIIPPTLHNVF